MRQKALAPQRVFLTTARKRIFAERRVSKRIGDSPERLMKISRSAEVVFVEEITRKAASTDQDRAGTARSLAADRTEATDVADQQDLVKTMLHRQLVRLTTIGRKRHNLPSNHRRDRTVTEIIEMDPEREENLGNNMISLDKSQTGRKMAMGSAKG